MGREISLLLLLVLLFAVFIPQPAYADVAPPYYPPGAGVGTESITKVQMVSETVTITIEASDEAISYFGDMVATNHIVGHVDAIFHMVNRGSEAETLEVWFPLGVSDGDSGISEVQDFMVWVDEEPVTTSREEVPNWRDYLVPRATWEVTFPPGETVILRLTYDLYPEGYSPYGTFGYILETGAGWWGSIEQGTVTVTMPYPINRFNLLQNPDTAYCLHPPGYTIDGSTLSWEFTDLEPTSENNISLTVLDPERWLRIVAAEANAAANPDSVEAHLELARARHDALSFDYVMNNYGDSIELSVLACAEYEQALALDPGNADIRFEYLLFLNGLWMPEDPNTDWETIYAVLKEGLSIDPDNERLLIAWDANIHNIEYALEFNPDDTRLQTMYDDILSLSTMPPTDTPGPTVDQQMATPMPPTPLPTPTTAPQPTTVPTPVLPSPALTPIAAETRQVCPGAAVLLLVPLGLVLRRKRE